MPHVYYTTTIIMGSNYLVQETLNFMLIREYFLSKLAFLNEIIVFRLDILPKRWIPLIEIAPQYHHIDDNKSLMKI